jgi:hypothetical protein
LSIIHFLDADARPCLQANCRDPRIVWHQFSDMSAARTVQPPSALSSLP